MVDEVDETEKNVAVEGVAIVELGLHAVEMDGDDVFEAERGLVDVVDLGCEAVVGGSGVDEIRERGGGCGGFRGECPSTGGSTCDDAALSDMGLGRRAYGVGHVIVGLGLDAVHAYRAGAMGRDGASEMIELGGEGMNDVLCVPLTPGLGKTLRKDEEVGDGVGRIVEKILDVEVIAVLVIKIDVVGPATSEELVDAGEILEDGEVLACGIHVSGASGDATAVLVDDVVLLAVVLKDWKVVEVKDGTTGVVVWGIEDAVWVVVEDVVDGDVNPVVDLGGAEETHK